VSIAFGATPRLYGLNTGFPANYLEVYTLALFPNNGTWETVVNNFAYLTSSSATYDGISGFDHDKKILYYSTDTDSTYVFRADVQTGCLAAPISVAAAEIIGLKYDSKNKRTLITYIDANHNLNIMAFSTRGLGYQVINQMDQYSKSWIDTALDDVNQVYYFIGANNTGIWVGHFSVATTFAPVSVKYPLNFGISNIYPSYLAYDPIRKVLVGVMESFVPSLHYYYVTINPTTWKTTIRPVNTEEFGIATCFAYHAASHTLYIGWAPNGPGKLYMVDILSGTAHGVVFNPVIVLSDIAVDASV